MLNNRNEFRGFYKGSRREKYWYGQLVTNGEECFLCSFPSGYFIKVPVEKDSIQEYIGLKDRKGTDIYEGDVLAHVFIDGSINLYKVFKWNGGFVCTDHQDDFDKPFHQIQFTSACADMQTSGFIRQCEVIGNMIANPNFYKDYKL